MSDREPQAVERQELYRHGKDEPEPVEGYVWRPVRGKDPTKAPTTISGWRGMPLPEDPPDEFLWPPDLSEEERREGQAHFKDKLGRQEQEEGGGDNQA